MRRQELQELLGLKHEDHFREAYLKPALEAGLIEMTVPDKPRSRLQKYRLTNRGRAWLATHREAAKESYPVWWDMGRLSEKGP
jgi:DNA-binding PadR family transcriptional regulator